MSTQPKPPPTLTELKLSAEMKQAINTALETGKAISIAYVNQNGEPRISYRGTTQAYSDTQLAIWVRSPKGGIVEATRKNPAVSLIYGNFEPTARGFMVFRGRAHVENDAAVRLQVYEQSPEGERNYDKERKGVPLIIDLESIDGFFGGALLKMRK